MDEYIPDNIGRMPRLYLLWITDRYSPDVYNNADIINAFIDEHRIYIYFCIYKMLVLYVSIGAS